MQLIELQAFGIGHRPQPVREIAETSHEKTAERGGIENGAGTFRCAAGAHQSIFVRGAITPRRSARAAHRRRSHPQRWAKGYPGRFRIYRVLPKRVFAVEELAKAAHEAFCAEGRARGETPLTNSSMRSWEELTEDLRDANRAQVGDIPNKLRNLGYELAPSYGLAPSEISITDAQVETMAIAEHDRWKRDRERHDWSYGPARDNSRKLHPLMVEWSMLSEPEKEKDRDTVRNLPRLIERAGFRVRKIDPKPAS